MCKSFRHFFLLLVPGVMLLVSSSIAAEDPGWSESLARELQSIDADFSGDIGVFVKDLDDGETVSVRADESWYLASVIKVPVAVATLAAIEDGEFETTSTIEIQEDDFVDGAGEINWHSPGDEVSIQRLLDQMLIHSDNTATDILIRVVGEDDVNAMADSVFSDRAGRITTLKDVRRHAYSAFHRDAMALSGEAFFTLKKAGSETERIEALADVLDVSRDEFKVDSLDEAFDQYYADNLNSAPLTDMARLFERLHEGDWLNSDHRRYLLESLAQIETGDDRIKAGLPGTVEFMHKTGTQHRRACNLGIATTAQGGRVFIGACTRGEDDLAASEATLRRIGEAVSESGALD